ncbi:DNA methyltransferase [Massilibacteroides sp.]|uniref:class I SAM-dependent DNA methyltransferase n=1 Tax=Massilibacteroides sp. TaxID=2034766 RepID=UPI00262F5889|nr:DNA methyltransferase [Massilibacteroides sp.]MDD4514825.1 class I SAM-dependent DNA methyltransferase [Massilibacteroides sp.]
MAIKTALTYNQIGKNLEVFIQPVNKQDIPYILLSSIGVSQTLIKRYKDGKNTVASFDGLLIRKVLGFRLADTDQMKDELELLKKDEKVQKNQPPILAVSDGVSILAYDPSMDESYENRLDLLYTDYNFFSPIWGVGKYRVLEESDADVKAAYKMAKLHDEIRRENKISNESDMHDLNLFMSRLLFCFFAEDTGIFEKDLFTSSIRQYTQPDGSDLTAYLSTIFNLMEHSERAAHLNKAYRFPYVNGGLFSKQIQIPHLGMKARNLILDCGKLNWKNINPDIFGSMIQAVVTPQLRSGLGLHYTSVPNIMKLIGPLFLDELYEEFYQIERLFDEKKRKFDIGAWTQKEFEKETKGIIAACRKLLLRMSKMKFFDPACGSGNFLIITYKSLRQLENRILELILSIDKQTSFNNVFSLIQISQFYGIEIDDFASETAILSLWLAEHQMNRLFTDKFGVTIDALPLKTNSNIRQGNACRLNWNEVCPHSAEEEVFVMGNPPYFGARLQEKPHKDDMAFVFKEVKGFNNLDYIACWFYKGAQYIKDIVARYAFVSTNSICQGEQVELIWPLIINAGCSIFFMHRPFKWTNNAKNNAGVTVSVIGVAAEKNIIKKIFDETSSKVVANISPYLIEADNLIVRKTNKSISKLPTMCFGSMPNDGGFLLLSELEKNSFIQEYPFYSNLIKAFLGSQEFIRGERRFCFWIDEIDRINLDKCPPLKKRILLCRTEREKSKRNATRKLADKPWTFGEIRHKDGLSIIIPSVSSEKREYIPIGILDSNTIISNLALAIYNSDIWIFGLLTSKMHMVWTKKIGGYLGTSIRYSVTLCYNTFPFPKISKEKKQQIEDAANQVLDVRDYHCEKTLAELYDPDKMPEDLREAHHQLDLIVDGCYQDMPFLNDEERLEYLFRLYEKMTKKNYNYDNGRIQKECAGGIK